MFRLLKKKLSSYSHGQTKLNQQLLSLVGKNKINAAEELIKQGADPNWVYGDNKKDNILFYAIIHYDAKMVDLLITHGAKTDNIDNKILYTPKGIIHQFGYKNKIATIAALIKHGIKINFDNIEKTDYLELHSLQQLVISKRASNQDNAEDFRLKCQAQLTALKYSRDFFQDNCTDTKEEPMPLCDKTNQGIINDAEHGVLLTGTAGYTSNTDG